LKALKGIVAAFEKTKIPICDMLLGLVKWY
jgi:hypothetical protein